MTTTDAQIRKLVEEMSRTRKVGLSAMKAGVDRKTARKYLKEGKLPSEMKAERTWRTRPDPFTADWPAIAERLSDAPELEAKALFEHLLEQEPGRYDPGQLRTFQRRVKQWRAMEGPPKEVFFAQEHRPGEALQTDFTWMTSFGISIGDEAFPHVLCHVVLPYSNWAWATVCRSESLAALKRGVQEALFRLGRVPRFHQTDNSTAATHDLRTGKRGFNKDYEDLMDHFGMTPRTIEIGQSHQNGDVEAINGALKRRLKQHLLLRGSHDFESLEAYETWLAMALDKANRLRTRRLGKELDAMRPLQVRRLLEFTEESALVTTWSTIRVKRNTYSVPSRLIGETVRVRLYEDRLEVMLAGKCQAVIERLPGRKKHRINYRHIIWSLVQKPGAFARYRYREDLFPSIEFRKAYDALRQHLSERKADLEYLRLLHLAASTLEEDVRLALNLILEAGQVPLAERAKSLVAPEETAAPVVELPPVDLRSYDALLNHGEEAAQ